MHGMPDTGKIAAAFHKSACEYDHHVLVQKRVVAQVARSVRQHLNRPPEQILDVGAGTGALLECLHAYYPGSGLTGVDIASNMCARIRQKLGPVCSAVVGDAEQLPFGDGTFDLVVSTSVLQWVINLTVALHELRRVGRPGGDICLAFFCDGTLGELQSCFRDAAGCCGDRRLSRLHEFRTVDEVKSVMHSLDFERVVMSIETEIDWYDDMFALLRSIKNIGAGTVSDRSENGLGWRGILQETSRLYQERYGQDGRIPATYKVLYLNAHIKKES